MTIDFEAKLLAEFVEVLQPFFGGGVALHRLFRGDPARLPLSSLKNRFCVFHRFTSMSIARTISAISAVRASNGKSSGRRSAVPAGGRGAP